MKKLVSAIMMSGAMMVAVQAADPIYLTVTPEDAMLRDLKDYDGLGDNLATGWIFKAIGEANPDNGQFVRGWNPFLLSAQDKLDIAAAEKIEFRVFMDGNYNVSHTGCDLYGYTNRTTDVAVFSDYEATDVELLLVDYVVDSHPFQTYVYGDVTAFVKAQALVSDYVICGLRLSDPSHTDDELKNYYVFDNSKNTGGTPPQLVITSANPPTQSTIVSISSEPGNLLKIVVETDQPNRSHPETKTDLATGTWTNVPHSASGMPPFLETDLSYSTTDGSNIVIYVQGGNPKGFYQIITE